MQAFSDHQHFEPHYYEKLAENRTTLYDGKDAVNATLC